MKGGRGRGRGVVVGAILAVVTVLAVITLPELVNAIHRGAQKRTMGDMRTISTAIESWSMDHGAYPIVNDIEELVTLLVPTHRKSLPTKDGWGQEFTVWSDGREYRIASRGADGLWDPPAPAVLRRGIEQQPLRVILLGHWRRLRD